MDDSREGMEADLNSIKNDENSDTIDVLEWLDRINKARNKEEAWRNRAKKIISIYRDDGSLTDSSYESPRKDGDTGYCFNILFSNVETLQPALFSNAPKPDVRNRHLNQDPNAEAAGDVIERSLVYSMDTYSFTKNIKSVVQDHLLTGRGTARSRLIPYYETRTVPDTDEMGQPIFDETGTPMQREEEVLVGQQIKCEGVKWDSLVIEPCEKWEDVTWIAFIHPLSKEEFIEYFPKAPLMESDKKTTDYSPDPTYKVYEIWDKKKKKVYYINKSETPLKIMDDMLKLTNFWPIPEPLYSIKTSNTLVPIPEYTLYQCQAEELNTISYRISDLIKACKFVGIYDSAEKDIAALLKADDSQFIPVTANRMKDGGIKGLIDVIDISPLAAVLGSLYGQRDQIKSIIYEITGIADIVRGDSEPSETATAQSIKARYAGLRLRDRRDNINAFIVDLLRIQTEMLCTFFTTEQLQEMSGVPITPEVEKILRSDVIRNYKIDIETDSTILPDMQAETQQRAALVGSIIQFLTGVTPLVVGGLIPLETAKALLMFGLQPAKISRELEDALEMIGSAPQTAAPAGVPPGMPPEMGGMPQDGASVPMPQGADSEMPPGLTGLQQPV